MSDELYSRVTIIDSANLFVTSSRGDFPSNVLAEVVAENVPQYTHSAPTIIVLESDLEKRGEGQDPLEPTPLARQASAILVAELRRLADLGEGEIPGEGEGTSA